MTRKEIKKLDKLWSIKIRERTQCEYCGTWGNQPHHIFSRVHRSTRWDLNNGLCLCFRHHIHWAHKEPVEFTWWLENYIGIKKLEALRKKSLKIARNQDFEVIRDSLLKNA